MGIQGQVFVTPGVSGESVDFQVTVVGQRKSRRAKLTFLQLAENGGKEPIEEVSNSRCACSQHDFCCSCV